MASDRVRDLVTFINRTPDLQVMSYYHPRVGRQVSLLEDLEYVLDLIGDEEFEAAIRVLYEVLEHADLPSRTRSHFLEATEKLGRLA